MSTASPPTTPEDADAANPPNQAAMIDRIKANHIAFDAFDASMSRRAYFMSLDRTSSVVESVAVLPSPLIRWPRMWRISDRTCTALCAYRPPFFAATRLEFPPAS